MGEQALTFAAVGDSLPEWLRIVIVVGFLWVALGAVFLALLIGGGERAPGPSDIQQGDGDWMWPPKQNGQA